MFSLSIDDKDKTRLFGSKDEDCLPLTFTSTEIDRICSNKAAYFIALFLRILSLFFHSHAGNNAITSDHEKVTCILDHDVGMSGCFVSLSL